MRTLNFRLGNLVQYTGQIVKVTGIFEDSIEVQPVDGGSKFQLSKKLIKPITLNEKWLFDFGFRFDNYDIIEDGDEEVTYHIYKITPKGVKYQYEIDVCPDGRCDFILFGEWHEEICLTTIDFVHELQNLYFVLEWEDLIYKNSEK